MEVTSTKSEAIATPYSTMLSVWLVASTIIADGAVISGGVVSTTETVCAELAELPAASVAIHVIIVSPTEYDSGASLVIEVTPTESVAIDFSNSTMF